MSSATPAIRPFAPLWAQVMLAAGVFLAQWRLLALLPDATREGAHLLLVAPFAVALGLVVACGERRPTPASIGSYAAAAWLADASVRWLAPGPDAAAVLLLALVPALAGGVAAARARRPDRSRIEAFALGATTAPSIALLLMLPLGCVALPFLSPLRATAAAAPDVAAVLAAFALALPLVLSIDAARRLARGSLEEWTRWRSLFRDAPPAPPAEGK